MLHHETDGNRIAEANAWLTQLKQSPEAWEVAWALFQQPEWYPPSLSLSLRSCPPASPALVPPSPRTARFLDFWGNTSSSGRFLGPMCPSPPPPADPPTLTPPADHQPPTLTPARARFRVLCISRHSPGEVQHFAIGLMRTGLLSQFASILPEQWEQVKMQLYQLVVTTAAGGRSVVCPTAAQNTDQTRAKHQPHHQPHPPSGTAGGLLRLLQPPSARPPARPPLHSLVVTAAAGPSHGR